MAVILRAHLQPFPDLLPVFSEISFVLHVPVNQRVIGKAVQGRILSRHIAAVFHVVA